MKNLKSNIYFKVGTIIIIVLLLLIPTSMIKSLIVERELTKQDAIEEVSAKWSKSQTISGPFITVPYIEYHSVKGKDGEPDTVKKVRNYLHILPTELRVDGELFPEKRNRGIYEIVVYNSKLNLSGDFSEIDFSKYDIPIENIEFEKAKFSLGINDLRGIKEQVILKWLEDEIYFEPGLVNYNVVSSGINSAITLDPKLNANYKFSLNLNLKGSQYLYFTPTGKNTNISLKSTWNNPSFNGAFLPDHHEITENEFVANWNVLHLNRNFPQYWSGSKYKINDSAFGVDLLLPVGNYQKSYRSIKYAILFIGFTFLVFLFIELLNRIFLHPIQYVLVGLALIVFFTLLLSISEYINFNYAFIVSALATLLLIAGYVKAILKSNKLTLLITGILLILYTFIFVIIQLQNYALLIGSLGVFIILGIVMYYSRKIDWYNLNLNKEKEDE